MLWRSVVGKIVHVGFCKALCDRVFRFGEHDHVVFPDPSVVVHCHISEGHVLDRHGVSVAAIGSPVKRCDAISVFWITTSPIA